MKIINLALRRKDGKIECDTVYSELMLTLEQIKEISEKYDCDVIASHVGECKFFDEEYIKTNTFKVIKQREEENNGTSESDTIPVIVTEE